MAAMAIVDLTGKVFSKLTVISFDKSDGNSRHWKCLCECGNETTARTGELNSRHKRSCGCLGNQLLDLSGQQFGFWEVLGRAGDTKFGQTTWKCLCKCGTVKAVVGSSLTSKFKGSKSCGCQLKQLISKANTEHGMTGTRTHNIWTNMLQRCTNTINPAYKDYGGRNIRVCDRWLSFENFFADMGECPPNMTIDRVDNDKSYEQSNCRWVSIKEQQNNRRSNRVYEYNGRLLTVAQLSEETGISSSLIRARIDRLGWSVQKALSTPVHRQCLSTNSANLSQSQPCQVT